jgi:hypothetical protein
MEVILLDTTLIVVIAFIAVFCIGGPIIGHYASKASMENEEKHK